MNWYGKVKPAHRKFDEIIKRQIFSVPIFITEVGFFHYEIQNKFFGRTLHVLYAVAIFFLTKLTKGTKFFIWVYLGEAKA